MHSELDKLIDKIYETALFPESWEQTLENISEAIRSDLGLIAAFQNEKFSRWVIAPQNFEPVMRDYNMRFPGNERTERLLTSDHAGFLRDVDVLSLGEMEAHPMYNGFLIPAGLGAGVATVVRSPNRQRFTFHFERAFGRGQFDAEAVGLLDVLRPHLARAAILCSRAGWMRAQAMVDALEAIDLAALAIDQAGRIVSANTKYNDVSPSLLFERQSRLNIADAAANRLLLDTLTIQSSSRNSATGATIAVRAIQDRPAYILHVLPICGAAQNIFSGACFIVIAVDIEHRGHVQPEILRSLFDLTHSESRLAALVGGGARIREAAQTLKLSEESARTSLKRIFQKTGVSRQAELVGLLSGVKTTGAANRKS